jgi:hypothetical protein
MKRRTWVIGLIVVGAAGWYLFRPELLFVNKRVNEGLSASVPVESGVAGTSTVPAALFTGRFHSVAHETRGIATVHQFAEGKRVLRLTDFVTSNGPDVRVYLVAASDAADDETVERAGFVELGELKGNEGNQNYDIPTGLDLNRYRAVTIWCRRFAVNFATAPLTPAS